MFVKKLPLLGFALLSPAFAMAQDTQLDDVVVTASRIEQKPEHVGSSMTVLTRETLQKRGDRTLVDALSRVPSVSFYRSGGIGGQSYLRLRGSNAGQTLVLIDGIRVGDAASTENAFDFNSLMAADIERIEVLRGNQSALYGSDAIGGVINITTYKAEKGVSGNAFLEGGSFGTVHGGASVRGGDDKVTFGVSANHFKNDGFSRYQGDKENDGNKISTIRGNVGINVTNNLNLDFSGGFERSKTESDDTYTPSVAGMNTKDLYFGQASATLHAFDDALKNNVFYRVSHTDRMNDTSSFIGTVQDFGYQGDIRLLERDVLTFGVDHRHEKSELSSKSVSANNTAYFANYVKGFGDRITLTLGGRLDDHKTFGTEGTYRSTIAYNVPVTNTRFHGSIGTGFKAPSLYQIFDPTYGNQDLEAEKSKGWDFGVNQSFLDDRITADVTYFKTDYENLIGFASTYTNLGDVEVEGVETSLDIKATDNLSFFGNYTFTNSEDKETGLRLARRPKHMFNIGTDISYNQFSVGLLGRYVGSQIDSGTNNNKPFFTADANVSYAVSDKVSLYARVDNILDHDYQETLTYNTPGVSAYGGIRINY